MGLFDKLLGAAKEIADGTKTAFENISLVHICWLLTKE